MQLGQPFVRNLQLHAAGRIGFDQVHKVPGDGARRDLVQEQVKRRERDHAFEQAADRPSSAHIHRSHFQDGAVAYRFLVQVDVVHAHYLAPVYVDDLLVEQVAFEQEQPFRTVGKRPVGSQGRSTNPAIDRRYGLQGQNPVPGLRLDDEQRNANPVFLRREGHFTHTAAGMAG